MDEIHRLINLFDTFVCHHIYMERNSAVDLLSKEAVHKHIRTWMSRSRGMVPSINTIIDLIYILQINWLRWSLFIFFFMLFLFTFCVIKHTKWKLKYSLRREFLNLQWKFSVSLHGLHHFWHHILARLYASHTTYYFASTKCNFVCLMKITTFPKGKKQRVHYSVCY